MTTPEDPPPIDEYARSTFCVHGRHGSCRHDGAYAGNHCECECHAELPPLWALETS